MPPGGGPACPHPMGPQHFFVLFVLTEHPPPSLPPSRMGLWVQVPNRHSSVDGEGIPEIVRCMHNIVAVAPSPGGGGAGRGKTTLGISMNRPHPPNHRPANVWAPHASLSKRERSPASGRPSIQRISADRPRTATAPVAWVVAGPHRSPCRRCPGEAGVCRAGGWLTVGWGLLASNCNTFTRRMEYAQQLMRYVPVHIYGKCGATVPCKPVLWGLQSLLWGGGGCGLQPAQPDCFQPGNLT